MLTITTPRIAVVPMFLTLACESKREQRPPRPWGLQFVKCHKWDRDQVPGVRR